MSGTTGQSGDLNEATAATEIRAEGADGLVRAYEEDVFGVPYVFYRRQRYWGLDRVDLFLEEYARPDQASRERAGPGALAPIPVGAYDTDTAGGCG